MPNADGLWTKDEVDAHVTAVVKERVDRLNNSHKLQADALREQLATATATASKHEAAAAKLAELTAAQTKAERDAAWTSLGIADRPRLRQLLEAEYESYTPAEGAERLSLAAWVAEQRAIAGSAVAEFLPPASAATGSTSAAPARPPAATTPAAPANPGAADPKAAAKAAFDAALKEAESLPVAERSAARQKALAAFRGVAT